MAKDILISCFSNEDLQHDFVLRKPDPNNLPSDGKSFTLDNTLPFDLTGMDLQAVIYHDDKVDTPLVTYLLSDGVQFKVIDPDTTTGPRIGFRIPQDEVAPFIKPKKGSIRYRIVALFTSGAINRLWGGLCLVQAEP
jgi:hypothetical protein